MTTAGFEGGTGFGDITDLDLDSSLFDGPEGSDEQSPELILPGEPGAEPDADAIGQHAYTEPDPNAIGGKERRARGVATYERKLRSIFAKAIKATAQRESTVPDSAALILYSPAIAKAGADLAAHDPRIARGVDMLFDGVENPYLNTVAALLPLFAQTVRNHEPVLEPKVRGLRVPLLGWRIPIPFKIGVKIPWLRVWSDEPTSVADHVFSSLLVQQRFQDQGVPIAWRPRRGR